MPSKSPCPQSASLAISAQPRLSPARSSYTNTTRPSQPHSTGHFSVSKSRSETRSTAGAPPQNESVLVGRDLSAAREAVEQVEKVKDEATPGRVVAELSFGFWVGLFANVYDQNLWRTDLYHLFSPRPQRRQLHEDLDKLRTLRNRIAHHEPIFQRALLDDYNRLTSILRSIDPHTCTWMEHNNRVLDVLAADPGDYGRF